MKPGPKKKQPTKLRSTSPRAKKLKVTPQALSLRNFPVKPRDVF